MRVPFCTDLDPVRVLGRVYDPNSERRRPDLAACQ